MRMVGSGAIIAGASALLARAIFFNDTDSFSTSDEVGAFIISLLVGATLFAGIWTLIRKITSKREGPISRAFRSDWSYFVFMAFFPFALVGLVGAGEAEKRFSGTISIFDRWNRDIERSIEDNGELTYYTKNFVERPITDSLRSFLDGDETGIVAEITFEYLHRDIDRVDYLIRPSDFDAFTARYKNREMIDLATRRGEKSDIPDIIRVRRGFFEPEFVDEWSIFQSSPGLMSYTALERVKDSENVCFRELRLGILIAPEDRQNSRNERIIDEMRVAFDKKQEILDVFCVVGEFRETLPNGVILTTDKYGFDKFMPVSSAVKPLVKSGRE